VNAGRPAKAAHLGHAHGGSPTRADHLDAEALLVALTLSPATYSRNRFFEMYRSPDMQRTRRRAGQLRGVVAALGTPSGRVGAGVVVSVEPTADAGAVIVYEVASLGLRRTVTFRSLEMALLRYCVGRVRGDDAPAELRLHAGDRERIGMALQRLSPLAHDIRASE
jgi:hypothetical protein